MTITAPDTNKRLRCISSWASLALLVVLIVGAVFNNQITELKRAADAKSKEVDALTLAVSELKNEWYSKIETKKLVATVEKQGLVRDGRPRYLTFDSLGRVIRSDSSVSINR